VTANVGNAHNRGNLKEITMPPAHESSNLPHRKRLLLIPPLIGLLAGFLTSFLFSPRYTSQATLLEKSPNENEPAAFLSTDIADQFELLAQEALSTAHVRDAVRSLSLEKPGQQEDKLIEAIHDHVTVAPRDTPGELTAPVFYVKYSDHSPARAQKICQMLTALIVEESLRGREQHFSSTHEFLMRQIEVAKARVAVIERELTKYRKKGKNRSAQEERKYRSLLLDYEEAKKFYRELAQKRTQAELSMTLEEGQRLRVFVLSPASLPEAPAFPNRVLCGVGGMASGLVVGIFLALGLANRAAYTVQISTVGIRQ
jgi:uncharacterized protein involved in exopolysaccharide biosynthesis